MSNFDFGNGSGDGIKKYAELRHEEAKGVNGGAVGGNAWRTCPINKEEIDSGNIVSLSSDRFILIPGKYFIQIDSVCFLNEVSHRLIDVTNTKEITFSPAQGTASINDTTSFSAFFESTGVEELEVQLITPFSNIDRGFGQSVQGVAVDLLVETYRIVRIYKVG